MDKYSLYRGVAPTGHPLIHLVEPGTRYGLQGTAGLEKTASGEHLPEVLELVESIQPQKDRLYLVNSAIGAGEYVGVNLRGDWFTEQGINHKPLNWDKIPVWDIDARRKAANTTEAVNGKGQLAWGFPTFYNSHRFRHHQNQDSTRAYGYILGAFWDQRMHRVVLVSELIREMCDRLGALDIYDRIAGGQFCDSSMGARVPSDECLLCGNEARSPANYCRHVNGDDPNFGMGKILPDGRVCGVKNHFPRFFDDSFVFVGAERSAKVMTNLTGKLKGEKTYTQTIYPFNKHSTKTASAMDPSPDAGRKNVIEEMARQQKTKPVTLEQHLTRILDMGPMDTPKDKAGLTYAAELKHGKEKVNAGRMDRFDLDMWDRVTRRQLSDKHQLSDKEIDLLIKKYEQRSAPPAKTATVKWAQMLKEIPAPSPEQLSVIRAHERSMPNLPKDVLEMFSEDPATALSTAARLGVVLKPEEFQKVLLQKLDPSAAEEYAHKGTVFAPAPLDLDHDAPNWQHMAPVMEIVEKIRAALLPLLKARSMAPAAVRIQIVLNRADISDAPKQTDDKDPLLQKISSLYNEYRAGLLADPPDWRYVPVEASFSSFGEEEDLVQRAQDISQQLLCLAHWPSFPVG